MTFFAKNYISSRRKSENKIVVYLATKYIILSYDRVVLHFYPFLGSNFALSHWHSITYCSVPLVHVLVNIKSWVTRFTSTI